VSEAPVVQELLQAVLLMLGLTFVFGAILAFASTRLRIAEDPMLTRVEELLGGSNCGACGEPGCRAFAEAVVRGDKVPALCTVSPRDSIDAIAHLLGVAAGEIERRIARLHCAGGRSAVKVVAHYDGVPTCEAAVQTQHGGRSCVYGCVGFGDCAHICGFSAIHMNEEGLPVVDPALCTACGDCVKACPAKLFSLMPLSQRAVVQCSSPLTGEEARSSCAVACDACGRCVSDAPAGAMQLRDGLPRIDAPSHAPERCTYRCPTGAIQWVEGVQHSYDVPLSALRRRYG
jgi:Na+-translocating ferredoxin:NAD+ oxidoreductase RNF subunit RnfB